MAEAYIDRFSGKIVGLLAVGVIAAWLFGYEFRIWIGSPAAGEFLALAILTLLWLTVSVLTVFFVKRRPVVAGVIFLEVAAVWSSLADKFSLLTLTGIGFLYACSFIGFMRGRFDLANGVKVRFFHVASRAIPVFTTGIVLFFTLYFVGALNFSQAELHKATLDFLFRSSEPVTSRFFPGFSADKPIDDALRAIVAAKLPEGTDATTLGENVAQVKKAITKAMGFTLSGSERFIDAFYRLTVSELLVLPPAYKAMSLIAIGVLIFGIVKGIAFFVNWFVAGLAFLVYEALFAMNFMNVQIETVNKEVIVVK